MPEMRRGVLTMPFYVYVITGTGKRMLVSEHLHEQEAWQFAKQKNRIITNDRGVVIRREESNAG